MALGDPTVVSGGVGTSALASVTINFSAVAADTQLILFVVADDYKTGDPSGWAIANVGGNPASIQGQHGAYVWRKTAVGTETSVTYTIASAANSRYVLMTLTGADPNSPVDVTDGVFTLGPGSFDYATPAKTPSSGNRCVIAFMGSNANPTAPTATTTFSNGYTAVTGSGGSTTGSGTNDSSCVGFLKSSFNGSTSTTTTYSWSTVSPDTSSALVVVFNEGGPPPTTVSGSDSETLSDSGSVQSTTMADLDLTYVGDSAWVAPASGASISPNYPSGLQEGDVVYAELVIKPDTATVATPANWTPVANQAVGGGTQGAGTGAVKVWVFKRTVPAGGLTGSQAFTITGGSSPVGCMRAWRAPAGTTIMEFQTESNTFYSRTTGSATFGGTGGANINLAAKDALVYISASADDQSSTHTISALAATGITFGTVTQAPTGTIINAQGNDISAAAAYAIASSGTSSAAPSATVSGSSAETGGGFFYRISLVGSSGANISGSDSQTLTDVTTTLSATVAANDSRTLSESVTVLGVYPATDSFTLSESSSVSVGGTTQSSNDSFSLSEVSAISSSPVAVDSQTLSEVSALVQQYVANDTATQTEGTTTGIATVVAVDSGTLADTSGLSVVKTATDSGTLSENTGEVFISDTGADSTVTEGVSSLAITSNRTDSWTLADSSNVVVGGIAVSGSDPSTISETSAVASSGTAVDSQTLSESNTLVRFASVTDSQTLTDATVSIVRVSSVTDSFITSEGVLVSIQSVSVDSGSFTDAASVIILGTSPFFLWNGTTEEQLNLDGIWNGSTVDAAVFDQVV